jgi:hypothetical protein
VSRDISLSLLHQYRCGHALYWTAEHTIRHWQLLHWLDQPLPGLPRQRPPVHIVIDAYYAGGATEADILEQLGGPVDTHGYYHRAGELHSFSMRKPASQIEKDPVLQRLVATLRARILEIELERGEMTTEATALAHSLRYSGGTDVFIRLLAILTLEDIMRTDIHGEGRAATLSHLLRASYPDPEDGYNEFVRRIKALHPDPALLIAVAVYAPQWARYIERALDWPDFEETIWWLHAHTRDAHWNVEQELLQTWKAQIAERTPLDAQDLLGGAVDVNWFWRCYQGIGQERWEQLYAAAKFASGGNGHGRARLFADAMTGKLSVTELLKRVNDKRQQDAVRALGLVPLPNHPAEREAEITRRYVTLQDFQHSGRKFGAQRRSSEGEAVRIGLANLARTAGYSDALRLQWAMEARSADDLRQGSLEVEVDELHFSLKLNVLTARPHLAISKKNGKELKTPPAKYKKHADVAVLLARKQEIEQQIIRMRETLEDAMCRGGLFTPAELLMLLDHPVLMPLLHNLVFVRVNDRLADAGTVLGYPRQSAESSGAQLVFNDYDGATVTIEVDEPCLRIAHPYDLLRSGNWHAWQRECFGAERIQPFKQIFRELYVLAASELHNGDEKLSQRYSGHQIQPNQANALFGHCGWIGRIEENVRRIFHAESMIASLSFGWGAFTPAEVGHPTVEHVYFINQKDEKLIPLAQVPPRLFSEVMRDLDLVVSVAHSGGVDPEASASTVEMRTTLVKETCSLLRLTNVEIKSSHAIITGALGNYSIHLGSAVVHRLPGGALCIVPVHVQQRGRLFLPFADDDPKTAEVVSKVVMLARDQEIKDPSILEQIL